MRRRSLVVTHASRFPELMTRRAQSSTAIAQVSQRASLIQSTAETASAKPKRLLSASTGTTDSQSMLRRGAAVITEKSTRLVQTDAAPPSPSAHLAIQLKEVVAMLEVVL